MCNTKGIAIRGTEVINFSFTLGKSSLSENISSKVVGIFQNCLILLGNCRMAKNEPESKIKLSDLFELVSMDLKFRYV